MHPENKEPEQNPSAMRQFLILAFLVAAFTGSAQDTLTFIIEGMSCTSCARTATQLLRELEGVEYSFVDFDSKRATVVGTASPAELRRAIRQHTNFEALIEGDTLLRALTEMEKKGLNIETIRGGRKMKFKNHLAPGKITVFDFYADWCAPCRVFSPKLEHLVKNNPRLALRKVDIVSWDSELAKQLTKNYKMPALPFTLIFDEKGRLLGKVEGNDIEKVEEIIARK